MPSKSGRRIDTLEDALQRVLDVRQWLDDVFTDDPLPEEEGGFNTRNVERALRRADDLVHALERMNARAR